MPWTYDAILLYDLTYRHEGSSAVFLPLNFLIEPRAVIALVGQVTHPRCVRTYNMKMIVILWIIFLSVNANRLINSHHPLGIQGSAGKTTALRLIARHMTPTTGFIAYPPSWRVRFLDSANPPFFFRGTLIANLRFGNVHHHTEDEILSLCRLIGVSDDVLSGENMMSL